MATAETSASSLDSVQRQKLAEEYKNKGNEFFKEHKFHAALEWYSKSLELFETAAAYGNRAFVYTRLEQYGAAIADASSALRIDPKYTKAFYRRGTAQFYLCHYKEALKDFKQAVTLHPHDKDAQRMFKDCEKEVKRIRFEEAIAAEHIHDRVSTQIHPDQIEVDASYEGPRIPESGITKEFVFELIEHLKRQKKLHQKYAYTILLQALNILQRLPSVVHITVPDGESITVCGDVHGQYFDFLNIFSINGFPSAENPYLFNGDFVDRGSFSVEIMLVMLAFKVLYPDHFHLTRGNHESRHLNKTYGFEGEVRAKYSERMFELFQEIFNWLPLAMTINRKVLVLHGGLFSRDNVTLAELEAIDRNRDIPEEGLMCEMLWSDPVKEMGRHPSKRGVGVGFGPDVTKRFLDSNGLDLLVRSHEMKDDGYETEVDGRLVTVFSAPNYCDQAGNKGAFIRFRAPELRPEIKTFSAVPHPDVKPMAYASHMMWG